MICVFLTLYHRLKNLQHSLPDWPHDYLSDKTWKSSLSALGYTFKSNFFLSNHCSLSEIILEADKILLLC